MPKKLDYTFVKDSFEGEGYIFLATDYINAHTKMEVRCPSGHTWNATWAAWSMGRRCYLCHQRVITIDEVREELVKEGYTLLSKSYTSLHQHLRVRCPSGHEYDVSWAGWLHGNRCVRCSGRDRWDRDKLERAIEGTGLKLLSSPAGRHGSVTIECAEGHVYKVGLSNLIKYPKCSKCNTNKHNTDVISSHLNSLDLELIDIDHAKRTFKSRCSEGHISNFKMRSYKAIKGCKICQGYKQYSLEQIRNEMDDEGYILLATEYKNCKIPLLVECPKGHRFSIPWDHWNNSNNRCSVCSGNFLSDTNVREKLESFGFELLSNFTGRGEVLEVRCSKGHTLVTSYLNLHATEFRCSQCVKESQFLEQRIVQDYVEGYGYSLAGEYERSDLKMHLICPEGHDYFSTWDNFRHNHRRCPRCGNGTSKIEKRLLTDVESIFKGRITLHDRVLLKPQEIDILIPDKKLAIELDGLYWHSEVNGNKDSKYHVDKLERCNTNGIRLITIFEDEYVHKREIVMSRLRYILGVDTPKKVHARKCVVKEIDSSTCNLFLKDHHIQGSGHASYKLGAFYDEELIAVMTFSQVNIAQGFFKKAGHWELNRFCVKSSVSAAGIASKLLKFFERNQEWDSIISFADRRWSEGGVYFQMDFSLVGISEPSYWYIKPNSDTCRRWHRFTLRKNKDDDPNLSEWENRQLQGYDRIWDCGSMKFIKENKNAQRDKDARY